MACPAVTAPAPVGWCPGALRPMLTGDGLVLRLKPRGGILPLETATALARLALRFGNGDLDLTGRANLQIRGVHPADLAAVQEQLQGLGLLDESAEAEAVRNIVAHPLGGLDHGAHLDIGPVVAALERRFVEDDGLWGLPAKWSMLVDDGGSPSLSGVTADLRFDALGDGTMRVGLGTAPQQALCLAVDIPDIAARAARVALRGAPSRMDALIGDLGADAVFAAIGLRPTHDRRTPPAPVHSRDLVGFRRFGQAGVVGLAAPFGSLRAEDLLTLAGAARHAGAAELRLSPWRVLFVPGMLDTHADALLRAVDGTSLITTGDDARLGVSACSGRPACERASTPVRADATALATGDRRQLRSTAVHVSGCAKGCAHPRPAAWTLVGRAGRYDLVRDGKAGDLPLAVGLTLAEAASRMRLDAGSGLL